jgi:uncharacterized protein YxjI
MENQYAYPLDFEFKIAAFAPQFWVRDANSKLIGYVRQKMFKLKEDITVFTDEGQAEAVFRIQADRWLDWSAAYSFSDPSGKKLGKIARKGMRSVFKAHYELFDENDQQDLLVREDNFWTRVGDAALSEIPVLGMFTGYVFNPKYNITRPDGTLVACFSKEPSFFGRKFKLTQLEAFETGEEQRILLGLMMLVLLERRRG